MPALAAQKVGSADDILAGLAMFREKASTSYEALTAAVTGDPALGEVMVGMWEALRDYEPRPFGGDVLYLAARHQLDPTDIHAAMFWMGLCDGPFTLQKTPGDHFTMLEEPQVEHLAGHLARHLDLFERV